MIILFVLINFFYSFEYKYDGFKKYPQDQVICFNPKNPNSYQKYIDEMNNFIIPYKTIRRTDKNVINCFLQKPSSKQVCFITAISLFPCTSMRKWGYDDSLPCIILTYSNDPSYKPIAYKNIKEIPFDIPGTIENEMKKERKFQNKLIRIYCTYVKHYNYFPMYGFYEFFSQ